MSKKFIKRLNKMFKIKLSECNNRMMTMNMISTNNMMKMANI